MKKITLLSILALLLCVVSCQISTIDNGLSADQGLKVTAVIDNSDATRVSYAVDNEAYTITPTWSVGDKIIGIDDKGETFTFTVESLDGDKAILNIGEYALCSCAASKLYAFYAPGCTENEIVENVLTVGLNPQDGTLNDETKVLMSAVAPIVNGGAALTFKKETAILGLKKFKLPVTEPTTITSMELVGVPSYGEFSVADDDITFIPGTTTGVITLKGEWTTDAEGVCTTPVYFSVAPKAAADIVINMSTGSEHFTNVTRITGLDIEAGYYYHMAKVMDEPAVQIGDNYFGSLEEAFAVASTISGTPVTIKLLKDCTLTSSATLSNAEGLYTLDLNGKSVVTNGSSRRIDVIDAQLTLTDSSSPNVAEQGKITTVETNTSSYMVSVKGETGKLIMEAGNIVATGYRALYFVDLGNGELTGGKITAPKAQAVTVSATGGTVNISGTFEAYAPTANVVRYYGGDGTISGGKFTNETTSAVIYVDGEAVVNVTGGYFKTTNINTVTTVATSKAYVTGGCHSVAVRDIFAVDAQSRVYYNVPNPDNATRGEYPYTVVPAASNPLVATVISSTNVWKHASIVSAGSQADLRAKNTAATTLKIETDLNAAETFSFPEAHKYMITVDMNGHKLNSTASPALTADCPMTLMDSGESGAIITTGAVAVLGLGDVTVNGGAYEATSTAVAVADTCALVINNGYFYGDTEDVAKGGADATVSIYGGFFKNNPDISFIAEGCGANPIAETHLGKTYNFEVAASSIVATVNGVGYASLGSAATAATAYAGAEDTVLLVLQEDVADALAIELNNESKPVVFDLNGHTVTTSAQGFIKTTGTLTITDNGATKGGIFSTATGVVNNTTTGKVHIKGCTIASSATSSSYYSAAVVYQNAEGTELTISDGAVIYSTDSLTVVANRAGKLTIDDCEISVGTQCTGKHGKVAVTTGGTKSSAVINGGSFYSTATSRAAIYTGANISSGTATGPITINGGYFYADKGSRCVRGAYHNQTQYIILNGGYFNIAPNYTSGGTDYKPTYGEGLSQKALDPAATHHHNTTNQDYSYGFTAAVE